MLVKSKRKLSTKIPKKQAKSELTELVEIFTKLSTLSVDIRKILEKSDLYIDEIALKAGNILPGSLLFKLKKRSKINKTGKYRKIQIKKYNKLQTETK